MGLKSTTSCMGYQRITALSGSTALTLPTRDANGALAEPTLAIIICETQAVRWRDDGTAPTSTVGMPLATGVALNYDGDLNAIRFIEQTASAVLHISYYA